MISYEEDRLETSESVMNFYKKQELEEIKAGVKDLLTREIPYMSYDSINYDEEDKVLTVVVNAEKSEIKKARKVGKFSEVKTMINRTVGGAVSPHILASVIRLVVILKYRKLIFSELEVILNCEIHNNRFEYAKHAGT